MRVGIDLGGTKTEVAAFDADGVAHFRRRVPTPADDYVAVLHTLCTLVAEAKASVGGEGTVGVGTPGALSPKTGKLRNSNTQCLNGRALDRDLAAALGEPVRIANDANCFALSEAIDGAGRDGTVVFGVILGTGTGGGIVIDKRLWTGPHAIAGEWGHTPLPWPAGDELHGPPCYCGKRGCIETFLSGPGLSRDYLGTREQDVAAVSAQDIAQRARRGEPDAQAALARYTDRLARALSSVINILDPDVIVLGGGLSNIPALEAEVGTRLPLYVFSDCVKTTVRRAVHGDASGVRGAAWLWSTERIERA